MAQKDPRDSGIELDDCDENVEFPSKQRRPRFLRSLSKRFSWFRKAGTGKAHSTSSTPTKNPNKMPQSPYSSGQPLKECNSTPCISQTQKSVMLISPSDKQASVTVKQMHPTTGVYKTKAAGKLGTSKIQDPLPTPTAYNPKISKGRQNQNRKTWPIEAQVQKQYKSNDKYRNLRRLPYCHDIFIENVIKDDFPSAKLLQAYEYEKREIGRTFEEVIMETGCDTQSSWLVRVAVRFSQRSNKGWLDNFLRTFTDKSSKILRRCFVDEVKKLFLKLNEKSLKIFDLWVGYSSLLMKENICFDTLVVITHTPLAEKIQMTKFCGLAVEFRDKNTCSTEAKALLQHESLVPLNIQITDNAIKNLITRHSNVTILTISGFKSRGFNTVQHRITMGPCVVIHCRVKGIVPFGESPFPLIIGDFPVDVREGFCDFASNQDELHLGQKIGPTNTPYDFGTLGGFVNLPESKKGFITCAHVVCSHDVLQRGSVQNYIENNTVMIADKGIATQREPVGMVKKAAFRVGEETQVSVDAAVIEIGSRFPKSGDFAIDWAQDKEKIRNMGFSETNKPTFFNGETTSISSDNMRNTFMKCGASTGLTLGRLRCIESHAFIVNQDVKISNNVCKFYHQMEVIPVIYPSDNFTVESVPPFISHGDSGSFVFMIVSNSPMVIKCVGLAVAVTSYGSCLMTPVDQVFSALGLPSDCLMQFSPSNASGNTSKGQDGVSEETLKRLLAEMQFNISQELRSVEHNLTAQTAELAGRVSTIEQKMEEQKKLSRLSWYNTLCSVM